MRFAITGANGFIGSYLTTYLREHGHEVEEWVRQPKNNTQRLYNLAITESIPSLTNLDALVHTAYIAYDKRDQPNAAELNIKGTLALEAACRAKGIQFIFLSSLSAHEMAVSIYGKHKLALENSLDLNNSLVLKLGLVIGKGGLFQRMVDTILRIPILPLPDGGKQSVQIVAISDVAKTIEKCAGERRRGRYLLAHPDKCSIKGIYTTIAQNYNRKLWLIDIPVGMLYPIVYTAEKLSIKTGITTENLKGLANSKYHDSKQDLHKLGITLMPLSEALKNTID